MREFTYRDLGGLPVVESWRWRTLQSMSGRWRLYTSVWLV